MRKFKFDEQYGDNMKRLNDYFFSTSRRKEIEHRMSLRGKLEAMLGKVNIKHFSL